MISEIMKRVPLFLLALICILVMSYIHEVGHWLAYKTLGFKKVRIGMFKKGGMWMPVCYIDVDDIGKSLSEFFESKGVGAWKYQVYISLSGLAVNILFALGMTIMFTRALGNKADIMVLVVLGILAFTFWASLIENWLTPYSDGWKVKQALWHKGKYWKAFKDEIVRGETFIEQEKALQRQRRDRERK